MAQKSPSDNASAPEVSLLDQIEALIPDEMLGETEADLEQTDEHPEGEAADTDDTPEEGAEVEEGDEESDEDASDSEEGEEESEEGDVEEAPAKYRVKVDGEEVEVDHDELLKGYSRTAAFTKKSMALAEEKKSFEAERAAVQAERQAYAQYLDQLAKAVQPQEPDWNTIRSESPEKLPEVYADYQLKLNQFKEIEAEKQATQQKIDAENIKMLRTHLSTEQQKLVEAVPEWKDPEKFKAGQQSLRKYATEKLGFTDDDLAQVRDHRVMLLLRKAMLFDGAQAPKQPQKAGTTPVTKKTLKPGARVGEKTPKKVDAARKHFAKDKGVRSAASYIESLLPD